MRSFPWRAGLSLAGLLSVSSAVMSAETFPELMRLLRGFQESQILLTAVELDVWTVVGEGGAAPEIASRLNTDPRATETFLHALVAVGALEKRNGRFYNTAATARHLSAGSPDNARPALMHTVYMARSWATLTECLRAGTAVRTPVIEEQNAQWTEAFIEAMHRGGLANAAGVVRTVGARGVRRLLDIGGGSGAYAIEFARAEPALRAEILDLASVAPIAQRHVRAAGLEERVTIRVGDLRTDDFGRDYDLILLSSICHMLPPDENRDLLRRCARALAVGGRLVIRDFLLEPDRTAPKAAALFSINMLVGTRAGAAYTEGDYREWLREAGFASVERPDPAGDLLIARWR